MMDIHAQRREKVLQAMQDESIALIFAGKAPALSEDENYPFEVNRNFFYLTGLDKEEMILVLVKRAKQQQELLFIPPYDEFIAKWIGGRMSRAQAQAGAAIKDVRYLPEFNNLLASLYNYSRYQNGLKLYLDLWQYRPDQEPSPAMKLARAIRKTYPNTQICDLYPLLTNLRMIKDKTEIDAILKAIEITKSGIEAILSTAEDGINETVLEGAFDFALKRHLCRKTAFKTIMAGGKRATVLHYSANDQAVYAGETVLCDLGAVAEHYCADISRTFPLNGKFTARQKELYNVVLKAQNIVLEKAKPGVSLKELNQAVIDYYTAELPKHGLKEPVTTYYFHSVSHSLGLDCHDVYDYKTTLKPGMVITDEPGLYLSEEGIGIRIEDDLLITAERAVKLSQAIISDPEAIEAFMAENHAAIK